MLIPTSVHRSVNLITGTCNNAQTGVLHFTIPPHITGMRARRQLTTSFHQPINNSLPSGARNNFTKHNAGPSKAGPTNSAFTITDAISRKTTRKCHHLATGCTSIGILRSTLANRHFRSFIFSSLPNTRR